MNTASRMSTAGLTPKIKSGIFPLRSKTMIGLLLDTLTYANVVQPFNNVVRSRNTLYLFSECWWCVMQCRWCDALTYSCWICLVQISVRFKVISSVPCVYFSCFTSDVHCSFLLRHFLKKLRKRLLVSSYRSVCLSVCPFACIDLTHHRRTSTKMYVGAFL
jgi:hypothetical protein